MVATTQPNVAFSLVECVPRLQTHPFEAANSTSRFGEDGACLALLHRAAQPAVNRPVDGCVRRYFGAARTRPYLDMTATRAALSGWPPALITTATSLKY